MQSYDDQVNAAWLLQVQGDMMQPRPWRKTRDRKCLKNTKHQQLLCDKLASSSKRTTQVNVPLKTSSHYPLTFSTQTNREWDEGNQTMACGQKHQALMVMTEYLTPSVNSCSLGISCHTNKTSVTPILTSSSCSIWNLHSRSGMSCLSF